MKKAVLVIVVTIAFGPLAASAAEGFEWHVSRIGGRLEKRMRGNSWHKGCPVPIHALRQVYVGYHDFAGERKVGRLVAHKDALDVLRIGFRSMWRRDVRIRRIKLADRYGSNDQRMMRADATSVFNCRFVSGTSRWSQHAYGRAVDINPIENPFIGSDGSVSPKKGRRYRDRSRNREGMIHAGDSTVRAFKRAGWGWGGSWSSSKDYMHFSATGT